MFYNVTVVFIAKAEEEKQKKFARVAVAIKFQVDLKTDRKTDRRKGKQRK